MFETLSQRLQAIAVRLRGQARISEADLDSALREIRMALLEADVDLAVVRSFMATIREQALKLDLLSGLRPGDQVIKLVHDQLVEMLGGDRYELAFSQRPGVLMLVGLQGSGKTTSAAKLGLRLRRDGKRVMLVAADVYRPAAIEQLIHLADQIGLEVHSRPAGTPPVEIATSGLVEARARSMDVVIIDTAGRLHLDEPMMDELVRIAGAVRPDQTLLVVDAMTGQQAVPVAKAFAAHLPLSALVLSKMDGDARGGAALGIRSASGLPVAYLGTGERPDGLEALHPDRLAQRILGMGDIVSLVERAQDQMDTEAAEQSARAMLESRFSLEDFRSQLTEIKKLGPIGQVMQMIPGAGGLAGAAQAAVDDGELRRIEAIIDSMTPAERRQPSVIGGSRRRRIAAGSGTTVADVNRLLKQFDQMQKLMRQFSKGRGALPVGLGSPPGR